MRTVHVTIRGTTPLLCGRPAEDPPDGAKPVFVAASRLYTDAADRPVIPGLNLFRCITGAARFLDQDDVTAVTALAIDEMDIPIEHASPWRVDVRSVRNRVTRHLQICYRPRFDDWLLRFTLQIDTDLIAEEEVRDMVMLAGRRLGLGDYRAERGGPFGRFTIDSWEAQ